MPRNLGKLSEPPLPGDDSHLKILIFHSFTTLADLALLRLVHPYLTMLCNSITTLDKANFFNFLSGYHNPNSPETFAYLQLLMANRHDLTQDKKVFSILKSTPPCFNTLVSVGIAKYQRFLAASDANKSLLKRFAGKLARLETRLFPSGATGFIDGFIPPEGLHATVRDTLKIENALAYQITKDLIAWDDLIYRFDWSSTAYSFRSLVEFRRKSPTLLALANATGVCPNVLLGQLLHTIAGTTTAGTEIVEYNRAHYDLTAFREANKAWC